MNFILIPKLYYTTRTTYWVGSPKDVLFSHTTPQGANHLSLHQTNRHRYHPTHQSVSSLCTPQRSRHGLHAQGRGFSCPQLLIFLQPWNLALGALENTNSYSSFTTTTSLINHNTVDWRWWPDAQINTARNFWLKLCFLFPLYLWGPSYEAELNSQLDLTTLESAWSRFLEAC